MLVCVAFSHEAKTQCVVGRRQANGQFEIWDVMRILDCSDQSFQGHVVDVSAVWSILGTEFRSQINSNTIPLLSIFCSFLSKKTLTGYQSVLHWIRKQQQSIYCQQ